MRRAWRICSNGNVGSEYIQQLIEGSTEDSPAADVEIEMKVTESLKVRFRPEFLNRIDETIIFQQLTRDDLAKIAEIQMQYLRNRLAERDMDLTLTDAARDKLSKDGFDPSYGARPLKRLIQHEIENPLAKRIVEGRFVGGDTILVDATGEVFSFEKAAEPLSA